jgi:hypothetical protein
MGRKKDGDRVAAQSVYPIDGLGYQERRSIVLVVLSVLNSYRSGLMYSCANAMDLFVYIYVAE